MSAATQPTDRRTRQDLLSALAGVFERRGYEGATLSQLAEATGLSRASLYHHFPGGKREMAAVLVRDAVSRLHGRAFGQLSATGPPAARLLTLVEGFEGYVADGDGRCLLAVMALASASGAPSEQIHGQYRDWLDGLARLYEALGHKPKRARREATDLLAELYGLLLSARLLDDPEHFHRGMRRLRKRLQAQFADGG